MSIGAIGVLVNIIILKSVYVFKVNICIKVVYAFINIKRRKS